MDNGRKTSLPQTVRTLGWVSFLTDVAADMIYPLLPGFVTRTLSAGPAALGLIEGVAESTASLLKMVSGWWSDRVRRRKPLVVAGYSIATLARPLVGLATSWPQVLAIRFTDRVGKGIRTAPRDALLADLVPPERRGRAFGLQRAMDNAGSLVGPLVAALLLRFWIPDERGVFLLAFVPGLGAVLLLLWKVPESRREIPAPKEVTAVSTAERLPASFWTAIAIFFLFTLANSTDAFLLLKAQQVGVPLWQLPLLWAFFHSVKAAAGVPGGILADRIGRVPTVSIGWTIYALAYAGLAFATGPGAVWGLFAFYALFFALTEGAERALVADLVPPSLRGRAFGVFHGSVGLAALPASFLFGLWWQLFGARTAFLIGSFLALAATSALIALRGRMRPEGEVAVQRKS